MRGEVQAIAKGGAGIVRHQGRVIFVAGVLPGERIEFSIVGSARSVLQGRLDGVLEPSPQRIPPACPHYPVCGGCNLQHASYPAQLEIKQAILADNLRRLAGSLAPIARVHPSPPLRYRTRTVFRVDRGRVGLLRRHSRQVEPLRTCLLVPEAVEAFALGERLLPEETDGELTVLSDGRQLSARLDAKTGSRHLAGPATIEFALAGFRYSTGPAGFIQSNRFQLETMIGLAQEGLAGARAGRALDLFSGAGFFTLPLAGRAARVFSVENDPLNLEAQRANLAANRIFGVKLLAGDGLKADLPAAELAVVDPPRGGLGPGLIHRLGACGVRRLIYFSCDSATFARDLKLLEKAAYALCDLRLIDNFPQTDHFEIYSRFDRD